jgi:FkbM family methyltransferase
MNQQEYREFAAAVDRHESQEPILNRTIDGQTITFTVPNSLVLYRIETIETKEPWTYRWAMSLTGDDVLVDIGANIGLFTLIAAKLRGTMVYAFEPDAQNYALLTRNIILNGVCDRAIAYCAAATERLSLDRLYVSDIRAGGSGNHFAQSVDNTLTPAQRPSNHGCIGISLDAAIATGSIAQPSHLKVDVDGFEHLVLQGAPKTLSSPTLRSVFVETNMAIPEHVAMEEFMAGFGFKCGEGQRFKQEGTQSYYDSLYSRA